MICHFRVPVNHNLPFSKFLTYNRLDEQATRISHSTFLSTRSHPLTSPHPACHSGFIRMINYPEKDVDVEDEDDNLGFNNDIIVPTAWPTPPSLSLRGISPQSCTETDFEMKTSNFVLFLLISVVSVHFRAIYDETIRCLSSLENFSFNSILVFVFVIMEDFLKSHKEWIQYQRKPLCVSWSSTLMTIKNHDFQQLDIHYVLYGSFCFLYRFNQS